MALCVIVDNHFLHDGARGLTCNHKFERSATFASFERDNVVLVHEWLFEQVDMERRVVFEAASVEVWQA